MTTAFNDHFQVEASRSSAGLTHPHDIECEVSRRLNQHPELKIKSLIVRRTPGGVCLEGRIETSREDINFADLMRDIPGLEEVINHLVISHRATPDSREL
jgi:osmotically-inducible protein OsmY